VRRVLVLSGVVGLACVGCGGSSSHPTISAGPRDALTPLPHRDIDYGKAGHLLGSAVPYTPAAVVPSYGGSPAADAAARAALWPRMLAFMRGLRDD
jgi:hypothetical protein